MLNLESQTSLDPAAVIAQTEEFFGPAGYGLAVQQRERRQIFLTGGGGSVTVIATRPAPGQSTTVQVQSREWDAATRAFLSHLASLDRPSLRQRLRSLLRL